MVVQHNLTAMNSNRMLGITTSSQAKSTEKLSSGYRINRAADDAAGLTISEKMRKQMRGLDRASTNAQDGVSAVQTAEGALTEVHSMLQRMNELANQAANGTNSESDRDAIQAEIDQLTTEIDRVAETTKFNESYLLKGNADGTTSTRNVNAHDAGLAGKLVDNGDGTSTFTLNKALEDGDKVTIAGKEYKIGSTTDSTDGYMKTATLATKAAAVGDTITTTDNGSGKTVTKTLVDKAVNADAIYTTGAKISIDGTEYTIDASTTDLSAASPTLKAADATKLVSEALADGKKATMIKTGTKDGLYAAATDVKIDIVSSMDTDKEISSLTMTDVATAGTVTVSELAKAAGATDVANGDVVSMAGETITATANDPVAMSTVKDVIKELQAGDKFTLGTTEYTIGKTTDLTAAAKTLTVDDALALVNDGNTVQFTTAGLASSEAKGAFTASGLKVATNYTAVETKAASNEENVISVKDAYKMMAEELTKASSIGTDEAAVVKSNNSGSFSIQQGTVEVKDSLSFNLHVGADADMTNKITVDISAMDAAGLGIKGLNVSDNNGASATYAIDAIADAISKVSSQRSALGAVQNRLEHTIANLDNVVENTTAAESRIRDTDMAED